MNRHFFILILIVASYVIRADEMTGTAYVLASSQKSWECDRKKSDPRFLFTVNPDKKSPTGIYIPESLNECFVELEKMLHPEAKKYLSGKLENLTMSEQTKFQSVLGHMNLGRFLRNRWGLWDNSKLCIYFEERDIFHPDDMSGIILTSYRRHLRKQPIRLAEQIKERQEYWKMAQPPESFIDPNIKIKMTGARYSENRYIHFGINETTGEIWCYEYDKGWYKQDDKTLKNVKPE